METKKYLDTFWAVTMTSLYQAYISGDKDIPRITKLASRAANPKPPVGSSINNGTMLGICRRLVLFVPEGGSCSEQRELAMVNTNYWGGHTTDIVGLFLQEEDAKACYETSYNTLFDERWRERTIETLRAIGENHPYCSISTEFSKHYSESHYIDPLCDPKEWRQ
jgi:hypothetical protein